MTGGRHRGDARALDTKQRPIGHRSGAVVVTGVAPVVVGERATVDAFVFSEQKLVKPGAVPQLDEQLKPFYELGERYHKARRRLETARAQVWSTVDALPGLEVDAKGKPPRGAATAWRAAMRPCLDAADALDASARLLHQLPGLERFAVRVTETADAFTAMLALERRSPKLWRDAIRKLTTPEQYAAEGVERLRARGIEPRGAMARVEHDARLAKMRAARRPNMKSEPRTRLLVALWDASDPFAPGAIGGETIVGLTAPWSSIAWLGWCAAGRGESWISAWDQWAPLQQFQCSTIAAPRGAKAQAVKKSRSRNSSD